MISLAHIVNPFHAEESSDLFWAQPITLESMIRAKANAKEQLKIELLTAQFPEDEDLVPHGFKKTRNLNQSVLDKHSLRQQIKLPLIKDILDRLYEESDAEYLIYTNIDIGLYPFFYLEVKNRIEQGHDAFIINRRRLPDLNRSVDDLEEIYKDKGKSHPGFDCFVFHRDLYPKFSLAEVCIGVPFIGIGMAQNLFALAQKFCLIEDEILTFHLGEELFAKRAPREYFKFNQREFWKAMDGELKDKLDIRKFPYYQEPYLKKWLKWGLQPSIPIRLAIKLEWHRWFNQR